MAENEQKVQNWKNIQIAKYKKSSRLWSKLKPKLQASPNCFTMC
jgi:hypothetical protein